MEQFRLLAAIGLSFLVLFVWSTFFSYETKTDQNSITSTLETTVKPNHHKGKKQITYKSNNKLISNKDINSKSKYKYEPRKITVETPLFSMVISEQGALINSTVLKNYKENANSNSKLKELVSEQLETGNILTYFYNNKTDNLQYEFFKSNSQIDYVEVSKENTTISFTWNNGQGLSLTKYFKFRPDSYLVDIKIILENESDNIINDSLVFSLKDKNPEQSGYGFEGASAFLNGKLKQFKKKEIQENKMQTGHIDWIAIENRYFMSSIIPSPSSKGHIELNLIDNLIENKIVSKPFIIYPNQKMNFEISLFMGPKSISVLNNIGHSLEKAINFGMFDIIAKPCLWFMNKIYTIIPNYGIAIILLTFFTKLLLWPLGSKGYKSMSEMKKLQPLMVEIRAKYKDNKQKMNQEIMALYKTYKINPLGGCLPMLLQIPVFFALYRMLYQAIELRHAPFLFWINDLAAPDRLLNFNFSIPFMQPPYGIPVLTIIMGATMLLQQKMSPPPGDPSQAKMMMLMPVIFTFIFINFSSGLVLYWLTNNVLSISQQYYIQKKTS